MNLFKTVLILTILVVCVACAGEEEATPDVTATFQAAVSAELTRLAPTPTEIIASVATPTLAAVSTSVMPPEAPTPTLVPSATPIPYVLQAALVERNGIEGDVYTRGDVLFSTSPPVFGESVTFFLMGAFDAAVDEIEGAGIDNVLFTIWDASGTIVYEKVESTAAYCAFGGDFPCAPYDFSQNNFLWSTQLPLEAGMFSAEIVARGTNPERSTTWTYEFQIQLDQ